MGPPTPRLGTRHEGWDLQHDAGCLGPAVGEGGPAGDAHTGGRRGDPRACSERLEDQQDRGAHRRDRKTVRKYLNGEGAAQSAKPRVSCLDPYLEFIAQRFGDDPHVTAAVLFDELVEANFDRSYPTLVRELRMLELRPVCTTCEHHKGKNPTVRIEHPAGEELQIDWLDLHDTPWGRPIYVIVGALSHSGRFRTAVCEQMTIAHVAQGMHRIVEQLGGTLAWTPVMR